jgi:hypothetical protein
MLIRRIDPGFHSNKLLKKAGCLAFTEPILRSRVTNASAVKIYNAARSLARFGRKIILHNSEKRSIAMLVL